MIITYLVGDDQMLEQLRALPDVITSGLARAITRLGIELQRDVQQNRLSGQILKSRSGTLRSSIDFRIDQSGQGITAGVFTDLRYGTTQEYGFTGTVGVRASLRRITKAFGRPIAEKSISVRAYNRRMDVPERSFLRSALQDMTPAIAAGVEAALVEVVLQ